MEHAEYVKAYVDPVLEKIIAALITERPDDVIGFMIKILDKEQTGTRQAGAKNPDEKEVQLQIEELKLEIESLESQLSAEERTALTSESKAPEDTISMSTASFFSRGDPSIGQLGYSWPGPAGEAAILSTASGAEAVVGSISVNLAFLLYLTYFLPQLLRVHRRNFAETDAAHWQSFSQWTLSLQVLTASIDLFYGFTAVPQWQYRAVGVSTLLCLTIQQAQLYRCFQRRVWGRSAPSEETDRRTSGASSTRNGARRCSRAGAARPAGALLAEFDGGAHHEAAWALPPSAGAAPGCPAPAAHDARGSPRHAATGVFPPFNSFSFVPPLLHFLFSAVCILGATGATGFVVWEELACGADAVRKRIPVSVVDALGFGETALYLATWLPQLWQNYRQKAADAYSGCFLEMQFAATVCDLVTAVAIPGYPLPSKITPSVMLLIVGTHIVQKKVLYRPPHQDEGGAGRPCVGAGEGGGEAVHAENKFLAPRSRIEAEVAGDAEVVAGAAEEVATNLLDMFSLHPQPKRQAAAVGLDAGGEVGAGHADVADAVWEKKATSSRGFLEKRKVELLKTETGQHEQEGWWDQLVAAGSAMKNRLTSGASNLFAKARGGQTPADGVAAAGIERDQDNKPPGYFGTMLQGVRSRFFGGGAKEPKSSAPGEATNRQSAATTVGDRITASGVPPADDQPHVLLQVQVRQVGEDQYAATATGSQEQITSLVRAAEIIGDASGGSDSDADLKFWMKRDRASEHGADRGFANFGFLFGQHTNHHTLFDPALGFQIGTEEELGRTASGKPIPPTVIEQYRVVPVVVQNEAATFKNKGMSLLRVSGFLSTIVQGIGSGLTVAGALSLPLPFPVGPPTALAGLGLISLGSMIPKEQNEFLRMALIKRVKGGKGAVEGEQMIQMHTLIEAVYKDSYGLTNNGIAYLLYREECPAHIQKELKSIEKIKDERSGSNLRVHKDIPFVLQKNQKIITVYPCYLLEKNNGWLTMGEEYNVRALFSKGDTKTKTRLSWLWAKTFSWSEEHVGFKDKPEYIMKAWHFDHDIKEDTENHRRSVRTEDLGQSKTHSLESKLWYYPDSRGDFKEKEEQEQQEQGTGVTSADSQQTKGKGENTANAGKGILGRIGSAIGGVGSAIGGAFSAAKEKALGKTHKPKSVCDFLIYDSGEKDAVRYLNAKRFKMPAYVRETETKFLLGELEKTEKDAEVQKKLGQIQEVADEWRHLEVAFATEAVKQRVASRSMRLMQKVASGVSRRAGFTGDAP
eukprot:g13510.t1